MAVICGSMARSFGNKSRVGQLSMMAGAILLPSMSESDCVAKMTEASKIDDILPGNYSLDFLFFFFCFS